MNTEMNTVLLYVTGSDQGEAARIGRALVEERLCACANVIPGVQSIYRWEGEMQDGLEAVLITKTRANLADEAVKRIQALHSYDVPCVVVLPISGGNPAFLEWIKSETGQSAE